MSLPDSFFTIQSPAKGEFKDKGSKFLAFAIPIVDEDQAKEELKNLRKEHYAAAHVCWAYVIGCNGEIEKSSDDREPSGTAGKPILRVLLEKKLTFVLIAVVRYFGGKLLGVPGLIQAYGEAAKDSILNSQMLERKVYYRVFQACEFERQHEIIRIGKQNQLKFFPDYFESNPGITIDIPPSSKEMVTESLNLYGLASFIELEVIFS
ncbi:MAG: YigZ family protein [Bacteroidetes bacterium B1(2017)]|nr:MAG: YigZ family protein [Bacteroidetes bacterium B1(2017)]